LTGELPFRGSKNMIVHQVLHEEPRPPRRVNDKVPADLETICLKALAKGPPRRYQTARDLADDLRRWLSGEPIRARPVGRVERAAGWARRRPAAAALLVVSGVAAMALAGLGVGFFYHRQVEAERDKARDERTAAEQARRRADSQARAEERAKEEA